MSRNPTTLWRRIDVSGHEYCRLSRQASDFQLSGVALFEHEGLPCRLDYTVTCDEAWRTKAAEVTGRVGDRAVSVRIEADASGGWRLNGDACAEVAGCLDVDLNFSPSTNLLPIRRLALRVGQRAEVRAAWLRFPSFTLEPLVQSYTHVGKGAYIYQSASFVADLEVSETGLPISYGNIWVSQTRA